MRDTRWGIMSGNVKDVLEAAEKARESEVSEVTLGLAIEDLRERPTMKKLERVWRIAYLLRTPTGFIRPWTQREKGQVNHIVRDLGGVAAGQLLAEVVQHWDEFVVYLAKVGHKGIGIRPHIGLLDYHRDAAVEWIQERASACAKEEGGGASWDF